MPPEAGIFAVAAFFNGLNRAQRARHRTLGLDLKSVVLRHEISNAVHIFLVVHGHAHDGGEDSQGDDLHNDSLL